MGSALETVERLKANGEDFEWYPTTPEILRTVAKDITARAGRYSRSELVSVLDIGAGDGRALVAIADACEAAELTTPRLFAIEKAETHIAAMPARVCIVGTDFHQQTLIDKAVDVIFCNPPYGEFETWAARIINEARAKVLYFVLPDRWSSSLVIASAVTNREAKVRPLGFFDFTNADRRARCKVEVIAVDLREYCHGQYSDRDNVDPFTLWFDQEFKLEADRPQWQDRCKERQAASVSQHGPLVRGRDLIQRLEGLHQADLSDLLETFKGLQRMDYGLFKELGVDLKAVRGALRLKIEGLKNLYWRDLFGSLPAITDKLTSKSRDAMLAQLATANAVDFTSSNAYAVVLWAVKNANTYMDSQLLALFKELSDPENARNFKSMKYRVFGDRWRFNSMDNPATHYSLDYRLILNHRRCFQTDEWGAYEYPNGLHRDVHATLGDICTVGKCLGFDVLTSSMDIEWEPGKRYAFDCKKPDGSRAVFMEVKAFKKGTIHIFMDQDFMRRLNVEAARLHGWVKSPSDAAREIQELTPEQAMECFRSCFQFGNDAAKLLTA